MTIPSLFYRQGLSAPETAVYDAVMDGLTRRTRTIRIRSAVNAPRVNDICMRVLSDNPLVYDVRSYMYRTMPSKPTLTYK